MPLVANGVEWKLQTQIRKWKRTKQARLDRRIMHQYQHVWETRARENSVAYNNWLLLLLRKARNEAYMMDQEMKALNFWEKCRLRDIDRALLKLAHEKHADHVRFRNNQLITYGNHLLVEDQEFMRAQLLWEAMNPRWRETITKKQKFRLKRMAADVLDQPVNPEHPAREIPIRVDCWRAPMGWSIYKRNKPKPPAKLGYMSRMAVERHKYDLGIPRYTLLKRPEKDLL